METTSESLKTLVREKYGAIASESTKGCGCGCSSATDVTFVGEDYAVIEGYVADADLGLGCGVPTELAGIQPGHTVLDLGSGAGLDVFAARAIVGETGRAIGLDMTPEMIEKAQANKAKLGYTNVEFVQGDIEDMPITSNFVDVIISNCVLNLVPDKAKAFAEMHRVLKPGGHFCVSDIVVDGVLPEVIQRAAELYVGCVSGAMERTAYLDIIEQTGFGDIEVLKDREIEIPAEALEEYLSADEIAGFRESGVSVRSVTVRAKK